MAHGLLPHFLHVLLARWQLAGISHNHPGSALPPPIIPSVSGCLTQSLLALLLDSFFFFLLTMSIIHSMYREQTQFLRPGGKLLCLLSHFTGPMG